MQLLNDKPVNRIIPVILLLLLFLPQLSFAGIQTRIQKPASGSGSGYSSVDTSKLNFYIRKGNEFLKKNWFKPEMARAYIDSATNLCEKGGTDIPSGLHFLSAKYNFEAGDYSEVEEEMMLAETIAEEEKDYHALTKILLFKGLYSLRTGFFKESNDAYMKSIELARKWKITGIIQSGYFGIANVMNAAGDIKGYRTNLRYSIDAASEEKDTTGIEEGLLRLGSSYIEKDRDFHKVDSLLKKCLEISIIRKDTFYTGYSSANIGYNYYLEKDYDPSLYYYKKSLDYSLAGKQIGISANSLGNIGTIYRDLGNYSKAISFYQKSISQAKKVNDWYNLSWVYADMSNLYIRVRDTSKAYVNYVLYKQYSDSLLSKKSIQGLTDARIRYEADNHKKEITLLSLRLKNNRLLNFGFAGLIVLVTVIAILFVRGSKINARRRLSEMNRRISDITQANLRQQMNPHFIFNTLNSIQYFMYQHDKLATNNYLTKFSSLIRKVLDNSQHTSVSLSNELDALNLYLELESLRFKDKFDYSITVDEDIDPLLYKVPTMLIQPYVENSICHGLMPMDHKGSVKIDIRLAKEYLICTIEDNGIGREAAIENKKSRGAGHNSLGTQITNSRLDLVNSLYGTSLKTTYTDLRNEKGEAEGTRVEIQIPIMT
jgi:tetratricopeptide (TPR) repeat protein